MANLSRIEAATTAEWGFVDNPKMMTACDIAARRAAENFEAVEYDDALQDAYLYLAVRPEVQRAFLEGRYTIPHLANKVYKDGLWDAAVSDSEERKLTTALDPALDAEVI